MPSSSCTRTSPSTGSTTADGEGADREKKLFFQAGREQVALQGRWRLFTQGEVFPGVTAIPRPANAGPHHLHVSSGNDQLLIWGDTVHVPEVQTARPEVRMEFDTDRVQPRPRANACSIWSPPTA